MTSKHLIVFAAEAWGLIADWDCRPVRCCLYVQGGCDPGSRLASALDYLFDGNALIEWWLLILCWLGFEN